MNWDNSMDNIRCILIHLSFSGLKPFALVTLILFISQHNWSSVFELTTFVLGELLTQAWPTVFCYTLFTYLPPLRPSKLHTRIRSKWSVHCVTVKYRSTKQPGLNIILNWRTYPPQGHKDSKWWPVILRA